MAAGPRRVFVLGLVVAALVLCLDRLTKWWLINVLDMAVRGEVELGPFFKLVLFRNRGVSFGLFQGGDAWRWFLAAVSLAIGLVILYWLFRAARPFVGVALGLLVGGAAGNVYDRIVHGAVTDFFYAHWGEHYFPAFNVADAAISTGVALLLFDSFFMSGTEETEAPPESEES